MDHVADLGRTDAGFPEHHVDTVQYPLSVVVRGRGHLSGQHRAAGAERHDVGERAADVDTDSESH